MQSQIVAYAPIILCQNKPEQALPPASCDYWWEAFSGASPYHPGALFTQGDCVKRVALCAIGVASMIGAQPQSPLFVISFSTKMTALHWGARRFGFAVKKSSFSQTNSASRWQSLHWRAVARGHRWWSWWRGSRDPACQRRQ